MSDKPKSNSDNKELNPAEQEKVSGGSLNTHVNGVPGESTDDKHKDWIEVLSYSHTVNQ